MSRKGSALTPFVVLGVAVLLGGWFLQEGVTRDQNVYVQVRVFQEVVDRVTDNYVDPVEPQAIYRSAIEGVLRSLGDPNTSFIPAQDYEDFRIQATEGEYGGVGLEIVVRDGWVTVVAPIPGTPGARAGIRPGDRFVEVEGQAAEGWDVDQAAERLRGRPGTDVDVLIGRPGVDQPIPFTLTRAVISLRAVPFALRLNGDVGYVPLRVFRASAADEVEAAVDSLRSEGIRALILDLRGNPGGLLEEGVGVSQLFLGDGDQIVETRGRGPGENQVLSAREAPAYPQLPLVVLVNGTSASASEIVAGALQDHDRALLVGSPSYGKGSVQSLYRLSGGSVLRLTTARWFTPVGRSIDKPHSGEGVPMHAELTLSGPLLPGEPGEERPPVLSLGGRALLGGGGIVPDVRVVPDTLSTGEAQAVRALYRQAGAFTSGVFSFAVRFIGDRPELGEDFELDPAELRAFRAFLAERGVELDASVFRGAERYIRYQLESEIALQAFGEAGRFRRLFRHDEQLRRALELLDGPTTTTELLEAAGAGLPEAPSPSSAASAGTAGGTPPR